MASYLRENNNYEMKMLSIHEAVPGHYVQFRYNNESSSLVRRVFGNGSFIEGWAVWTEGMMLNAGYGNGDPRLRLFQLKWRLREEANAIIDAGFHAGSLTREQCIAFLQQKAFQERAEADNKWHRLQVSHVQLSTYYAGLEAIERARGDTQSRYDRNGFNRRLLQMGDVEPRFIDGALLANRRALTWRKVHAKRSIKSNLMPITIISTESATCKTLITVPMSWSGNARNRKMTRAKSMTSKSSTMTPSSNPTICQVLSGSTVIKKMTAAVPHGVTIVGTSLR